MKNKKTNPVQSSNSKPEFDANDFVAAASDGIERASREVIRTALSFWACNGLNPTDEIIGFLAHMTKEVVTGEIRTGLDDCDMPF